MKRIIFLIAVISPVVFSFCPRPACAQEIKSYVDKKKGEYSSTPGAHTPFEKENSSTRSGALTDLGKGYHQGSGKSLHLGIFDFGVEGKYLYKDPTDKNGDSKINRVMMEGFIGFRF